MFRILIPALLIFQLTACKQASGQNDGLSPAAEELTSSEPAAAAAEQRYADLLQAYHWRLEDAVDAGNTRIDALLVRPELPVQLDFVLGRLNISNTCNRMSGGYTIEGSRLQVGPLASTLMACSDDALTQLDQAISARFEGLISFEAETSDDVARLNLATEAGDVLTLIGHPTAETHFGDLAASATVRAEAPEVTHSWDPNSDYPFSSAVRVGHMLYLSGDIGLLPGTRQLVEGGIQPETRQTLDNIKATLEANGSSLGEVVKCTVFLADMAEWAAMNEVYRTYFPTNPPARSALGTSGLALGARTEIECIATVK